MTIRDILAPRTVANFETGLTAMQNGDLEEAEQAWLALADRASSDDCRKIADALSALAATYLRQDDNVDKAGQLFTRALQLRQDYLPANDQSIAIELNNLGMNYERCGNRDEAIEHLNKAVEILDQYPEIAESNLADPYDNLASLIFENGPLSRAHSVCQRALDIRVETLGDIHPHSIMSLLLLWKIQTAEKPHSRLARETGKEYKARVAKLAGVTAQHGDTLLKDTLTVASRMDDREGADLVAASLGMLAKEHLMLQRLAASS